MSTLRICIDCAFLSTKSEYCPVCFNSTGDVRAMISDDYLTNFIKYCEKRKFKNLSHLYKRRSTQLRGGYMSLDTLQE